MTARELVDYLLTSFREDVVGDTPIAGVERQGYRTLKLDVDNDDDDGTVMSFTVSVSVVTT